MPLLASILHYLHAAKNLTAAANSASRQPAPSVGSTQGWEGKPRRITSTALSHRLRASLTCRMALKRSDMGTSNCTGPSQWDRRKSGAKGRYSHSQYTLLNNFRTVYHWSTANPWYEYPCYPTHRSETFFVFEKVETHIFFRLELTYFSLLMEICLSLRASRFCNRQAVLGP